MNRSCCRPTTSRARVARNRDHKLGAPAARGRHRAAARRHRDHRAGCRGHCVAVAPRYRLDHCGVMTGATAAGHRGSAAATSKKLWQTAGFSITLLMFNVLFVVIVQCPSLRNGGICDDETPRCSRSGVFVVSSSAHASSHCGESSSLRTPLDQNAALLQCASISH